MWLPHLENKDRPELVERKKSFQHKKVLDWLREKDEEDPYSAQYAIVAWELNYPSDCHSLIMYENGECFVLFQDCSGGGRNYIEEYLDNNYVLEEWDWGTEGCKDKVIEYLNRRNL